MTVKIGINGFGRIGRLTLRSINQYHKGNLEIVAVNDLTDNKTNAHLLKWDSTFGQYKGTVEAVEDGILIDGKKVKVLAEKDPAKISWKDYGVDIVIESTGFFTDGVAAAAHIKGGAKKVLISAPATNEDITIVLGVNEDKYDPKKHNIISNASCTTNCVAPVAKVLNDAFGIEKGFMTTIHSYTNDQKILDVFHKDLRRARAAAVSIIPTTTGVTKAIAQVIPGLKGKLNGMSMRVPTPDVSVCDFSLVFSKDVTPEQVNEALKKAASTAPMSTYLQYCDEPLVSIDFKGNSHSSIVDALSTIAIGGNMIKVIAWYDNEWGYSTRLGDLADYVAKKGF
jgi:glyceraldehyde 3-phosphate dehydrogenase